MPRETNDLIVTTHMNHAENPKHHGEIYRIADELLASIEKGDLVIYFRHCETYFAGSGKINLDQLAEIESIQQEIQTLIDKKRQENALLTTSDLLTYAGALHTFYSIAAQSRTM